MFDVSMDLELNQNRPENPTGAMDMTYGLFFKQKMFV